MTFNLCSVFQICFLLLLVAQHATAFSNIKKVSLRAYLKTSTIQSKQLPTRNTRLFIQPDAEGATNPLVADPNSKVQGYMSSDLSSNEDGKQGRVLSYIVFALVPVLFLVPFFLSRGFDPPVDPDMEPVTAIVTTDTRKL